MAVGSPSVAVDATSETVVDATSAVGGTQRSVGPGIVYGWGDFKCLLVFAVCLSCLADISALVGSDMW